jgi:DNA-binding Lrp family transcriptional regulator
VSLDDFDRRLIAATQAGLPLVARPYDAVADALGCSAQQVRERLAGMLAQGLVRRIGAVPNHYRLGFTANGMTVWDVDDEQVDALGAAVGALPGVSHCYRRPRHLPLWRYNLFAMLHGRSRAEVEQQREQLRQLLGVHCRADDILYSSAILKKTGLRLAAAGAGSPFPSPRRASTGPRARHSPTEA